MDFSSTPKEAWKGTLREESFITSNIYSAAIGTGIAIGSGTLGRMSPFLATTFGLRTSARTSVEFSTFYTHISRDIIINGGYRPFSLANIYGDVTAFWMPFTDTDKIQVGLGGLINATSSAAAVKAIVLGTSLESVELEYQFLISLGTCAKIDWTVYSTPTVDIVVRTQGNISALPFVGHPSSPTGYNEIVSVTLGLGFFLRAKW